MVVKNWYWFWINIDILNFFEKRVHEKEDDKSGKAPNKNDDSEKKDDKSGKVPEYVLWKYLRIKVQN